MAPLVTNEEDEQFALASMRRYVDRKQELDKLLERVIDPYLAGRSMRVLDAGCGIGHVMRLLHDLSPESSFHGVEQAPFMVEEARRLWAGYDNFSFEVADVNELPSRYRKAFDLVLSWKVLCWLPEYETMLAALLELAREQVFISSLFYDGDIDFEIKVREHAKERRGMSAITSESYYNVYSLPRFLRKAEELGATSHDVHDFEIGIDLPRGDPDLMGTWTEELADGRRLQISGAVVMSWKVIRLGL